MASSDRLAFYTGLHGSSVGELFALLAAPPAALAALRAAHAAWALPPSAALEALVLAAPLVLGCTVWARGAAPWHAPDPPPPAAAQWAPALVGALVALAIRGVWGVRPGGLAYAGGRRAFVTAYRAAMVLATCVAILAVDFDAFPRRFAKTETFGVSLMDAGVGGFVFSMALTSRAARIASPAPARPPLRRAAAALRHAGVLWALGLARLAATRGAALDAHVTEYGVHWNFFMTLATISLAVTLLDASPTVGAWIGVVILLVYQLALSNGLTEFVFEAPRTNLLTANKEGACSWAGFLALYLIGVRAGVSALSAPFQSWRDLAKYYTIVVMTLLCALFLFEYVQEPSRRLANASYVILCLAANGFTLVLFATVDFLIPPRPSPLLESVNRHQLLTFLAANLMTGAVNLSIDTQAASNLVAIVVLLIYTSLVMIVPLLADKYGIKLKF